MPGQIEEEIKNRRLDQLMSLQQAISLEQNQKRVGEICEVLVEGKQEGKYVGRSIREAPESDGSIFFSSSKPRVPGQYVMVQLTGADAYDLFGEEIQ